MKQLKDYLHGERWKRIPGFEGYEASNRQRVRSIDKVVRHNYGGKAIKRGRVLSQHINANGYKACGLCIENKIFTKLVHRLIAIAFIQNPKNKATVNHKDGEKLNNSVSNLEWATQAENVQHSWDIGLSGNHGRSDAQKFARLEAAKKPVTCMNFRTKRVRRFKSITSCASALKVTQSCVSYSLIRGTRIQRKYEIKYAA